MSQFSPREAYRITPDPTHLTDFHKYREDYVVRPPYQRSTVWSRKKKQDLWDSLIRRFYVPRIVLREVRLPGDARKLEVVDGQQRISSVVEFFEDELTLPSTLRDLRPDLPGKTYTQLPTDVRRFVDTLKFDVDLVIGIDDPTNSEHQRIAAEIFWRLQQGETLTFMEIAHARLSSLTRNFVVKYADDIRFDFQSYRSLAENPDKHRFFEIVERKNDRMQHLALLARLVLLEREDGAVDIRDKQIMEFIDEAQTENGIGNYSYEQTPEAQQVLKTMSDFVRVFEQDPLVRQGEGIREFKVEYFIITAFLLLRHLTRHYAFRDEQRKWFREFIVDFYQRWKRKEETDLDIVAFSDNRQQSAAEIQIRHRLIRQAFFEWINERGHALQALDTRRAFNEAERIRIYRRDKGLCQDCIADGKSEADAEVPWREYDADHVVPHAVGGQTDVENARIRCRYHNRRAGVQVARA
jgi:hypothetical protein